jgi:DNA-binding XRE family transcriptional regulator
LWGNSASNIDRLIETRYDLGMEGTMRTIKELREERNLTQRALGGLIGVTGLTVYQWERDETQMSALHLRQLATALGVCSDEIVLPMGKPGKRSKSKPKPTAPTTPGDTP